MEDLLQHCMRELAFDGDLGCDVSRLRHFIQGFYASQQPSRNQNVDDAFHVFVWHLLVCQPSVRVGLVPEGDALEVYIAPQRRKSNSVVKSKKKQLAPEPVPFPALDGRDGYPAVTDDSTSELFLGSLQPISEAASSLEFLTKKYGQRLRVAVDPETCFRAITGTHIRPAKLSPMVYTALQLISRGREVGLSVIDLGKKTGYDQKTCFYVVLQLLSLDLVVKLGKGGPGGGNFCIHKYFYSQSAFWKSVRSEEHVDEDEDGQQGDRFSEHEAPTDLRAKLQFDPIDSRHLASTELIKSRVVKLLKNSENGLHLYHNLIVTIGFLKPTKQDRRFFNIRIRELIKDNVIEKVIVPKLHGSSCALCIRLVADPRTDGAEGIILQPEDVGDDEPGQTSEAKDQDMTFMPATNITIHRQILKLLELAALEGLTLYDISTRLGNFDKRTVELILHRLERFPPPSHLADLAACEFFENQGRERRHRYYTLTGYLSFIRNENIDGAGIMSRYTSMDISQSGGFYLQPDHQFYKDSAALIKFQDEYKDTEKPLKEGASRKIGRPRKDNSKPPNGKSAKDETTRSTTKPRGKIIGAASDRGEDGHQAQSISTKTTKRGTKRKRKDDPEAEASTSVVQPPSKKERVIKKNFAHKEDHLACPMDMDNAKAVQLQEPSRNSHSETFTVQGESVLPVPIGSNNKGLPRQTPILPDTSTIMLTSESGKSAGSLVLSSTPGVVPLEHSPHSQGFHGAASTLENITSSKRNGDTLNGTLSNAEEYSAKRPNMGRPKQPRVNISQLRAENEIMRVVDKSGGIANISSKEFWETYAHIISSMVEAGEPTSMPLGTQPDRRTINKLLERLVDRGKLKTLTTTLTPRVTQSRLAKLIYEPSVSQERLDQFVSVLREDVPVPSIPLHRKLDQPMHFTRPKPRRVCDPVFTQDGGSDGGDGHDNFHHGIGLSVEDDSVVRSAFQSETQVVAQFYGYLVGKARRARELHQFTLAHLQSPDLSSHIVSRTERVVAFPYFLYDLPVSTYCAIVSVTVYSPELSHLMETVEGRQTPVNQLVPIIYDQLKIGKSLARGKILSLLEILMALKLVTPLQPSDSTMPYLSCEPNGTHPICFDVAPTTGDEGTPPMIYAYWRFNIIAPIYLYSQPNSWPPPFHRDMFVRTADESMSFWFELEYAFLKNYGSIPETSMDSITGPCVCPLQVIRALRKQRSWVSTYVLSWSQKQYLKQRWTDPMTGYTPLSDQDGGRDRLKHICNIISAPFDAVHPFFVTIHDFFMKEATRIVERDELRREKSRERQATEDRALLAKKAAEARQQLEADWNALLLRVHSSPLSYGSSTKLKTLRARYLSSRSALTIQQWETAIMEATSGLKSGAKKPVLPSLPSSPRKPSLRTGVSRPLPAPLEQQKSINELIERYRDKVTVGQVALQKKKSKETDRDDVGAVSTTVTELPRRQRFQWTPEYDELARDASVVIRARCRTWYRMDWTAVDQLFPFLPRNSVRQRLVTLRQEAGGESYLRLLEDRWHELWLDHRGTEALPDDHPDHPFDFDAIAHVEFLRKYIDKRALRAGLSKVGVYHAAGAVLTQSVSDFLSRWDLGEHVKAINKMEFMWSLIGDEHREKTLLGEAFSTTQPFSSSKLTSKDSYLNGVAEAALKMTLTTLEEDYDARDAALLLDGVGQQDVGRASEDLLFRGVISQVGNSRRKTPGRKLRISDLNEEALGGSLRSDFFLDACAIEDVVEDGVDSWKEWTPVCTDGEMAAFIELASGGKVEFHIDVSDAAAHRQGLDWNSKKVDDDQIETTLTMRCLAFMDPPKTPPALSRVDMELDLDQPSLEDHGLNNGEPAPCRRSSKGIITCMACIGIEQSRFLAALEPEARDLCLDMIEKIEMAGRQGLSYEAFTIDPLQRMQTIVRRLTSSKNPLCYWVGYAYPVLVSRRHIRDWTISLPGPLHIIFPRRWLNIKGEQMNDMWNAGLRAVVGVLVARPGIPQTELRERLASIYDRQELNDLLEYLWTEEMIVRRAEDEAYVSKDIREVGGAQEQNVYWSLNAGSWYHLTE